MDKTLNYKINDFAKALKSLKEALDLAKNKIIRDSVIKRFEYCFELCWKTAKLYLKDQYGINIFSPKECFRELRKNKLIPDTITEQLLDMTNSRNEVIHTYNEKFANELYTDIKEDYYKLLKKIYQIIR